MYAAQLVSKAATASVPTKKVQDIEKNEVTDMSSDEHHKDLVYVTEAKSVDELYSIVLLAIEKVGTKWTIRQCMLLFLPKVSSNSVSFKSGF